MQNKPLIIGNWKMNPRTVKSAEDLFRSIGQSAKINKKITTVVCAPASFIYSLSKIKNGVILGGQDIHTEKEGPYTGAVSAEMMKSSGAKYILVGHSERRRAGDTDEVVSQKLSQVIKSGLTPILCVGESVRDEKGDYHIVVKKQIEASLTGFPKSKISTLIVAYEPVWAIGKDAKREATPEESFEMALFIKKVLSDMYGSKGKDVSIIYGGSVNVENAEAFLSRGGVQGVLVGRDSLNGKRFGKIMNCANTLTTKK
jgi:triosephosphate isomerase